MKNGVPHKRGIPFFCKIHDMEAKYKIWNVPDKQVENDRILGTKIRRMFIVCKVF